jgi:site-specific DNA recombinase
LDASPIFFAASKPQAIVRAHAWLKLLSDGTHPTIESLAQSACLHPKVIRKAIRMAFLGPSITKMILNGERTAPLLLRDVENVDALSWAR